MTFSPRPLPSRLSATPYQLGLLGVATMLVLVGSAAFFIDLPVAAWCKSHRLPGELGRLISLLEISGHSLGAALALIAALTLDHSLRVPLPGRWQAGERAFTRMLAATYFGGLIVDLIKVSVARVRPRAADLAGVGSWLATFGEGTLATEAPRLVDLMSFPSGHSAVAAGLAAALAWRYPHGLPLFAVLAVATAVQRVVSSAHYPSDTAFGAAVGLVGAACCLGGPRPAARWPAPRGRDTIPRSMEQSRR
ncbi:MAG: phosphatase PAP2 family protein [Planctomycetota bacterium]